jgi:outer membrane protein assembly factor BamB
VTTVAVAAFVRATHRPAGTGRADARGPAAHAPGVATPPDASAPHTPDASAPHAPIVDAPRMLHGDARHTHRARGRIPGRPDVVWTFRSDGPIEGQVVASPDESTLYAATLGGSLWALDRGGRARFHVPLGNRAYATPCVGRDGTVYAGSDGGALFAITPAGRVAWRVETDGDADTGVALTEGGLLVFGAGHRVYGVTRDGAVSFRFAASRKVFTAPALARSGEANAERVVVGSQDGHVYELSTRGELVWQADLGRDVDGTAAVGDDGAIYVGTDAGEVVRLEPDGRIAWRASVGGYVRGALSVTRDGDVVGGAYGPSPALFRLSPAGEVRWRVDVRGNGSPEMGVMGGALEDDDGALVFGAQDGMIHALGSGGDALWSFDAHADVDAPVTLLSDGTLIAAGYDGTVVALGSGAPPDAR